MVQRHKEFKEQYKKKFADYTFKINTENIPNFNPETEEADLRLYTKEGTPYYATLVTLPFLERIFNKNSKTGECASGSYFCMPDMIIIKKIDVPTVKATIDDLIENLEIENYFKK